MKRLLLALLILPLFAQAAEYELGKGYHFVKMSGKFYALPPMMAPAQNPSNADQALTRSWATASSAGYAGALAVVSAMGPSPSSNPSNANQVLSDVWNSANNALTIYCVSGCGSQGPTGPTGASGAAGATGATGATGSGGGGTPCTDTALSLQYNNAGSFGCIPGSTYNTTSGPIPVGDAPAVTVVAPGSGYAMSDTGTITCGDDTATYTVSSTGAGGSVTGITYTAGTAICTQATFPTAVSTGGGDGALTVAVVPRLGNVTIEGRDNSATSGAAGGDTYILGAPGNNGSGYGGNIYLLPDSTADTLGNVFIGGTRTAPFMTVPSSGDLVLANGLQLGATGSIFTAGGLNFQLGNSLGQLSLGGVSVANGSINLNGSTAGTAKISMADTTSNITMTGGSASMVVCWKADGISIGYATVAEISSGTCH